MAAHVTGCMKVSKFWRDAEGLLWFIQGQAGSGTRFQLNGGHAPVAYSKDNTATECVCFYGELEPFSERERIFLHVRPDYHWLFHPGPPDPNIRISLCGGIVQTIIEERCITIIAATPYSGGGETSFAILSYALPSMYKQYLQIGEVIHVTGFLNPESQMLGDALSVQPSELSFPRHPKLTPWLASGTSDGGVGEQSLDLGGKSIPNEDLRLLDWQVSMLNPDASVMNTGSVTPTPHQTLVQGTQRNASHRGMETDRKTLAVREADAHVNDRATLTDHLELLDQEADGLPIGLLPLPKYNTERGRQSSPISLGSDTERTELSVVLAASGDIWAAPDDLEE